MLLILIPTSLSHNIMTKIGSNLKYPASTIQVELFILTGVLIEVFKSTGRTGGHSKVGIVLTASSSSDIAALYVAVQKAHDRNIIMIAVGVGNYNDNQLRMIAS